jgi:Domain of unknown function (DUF4149)
MINRNLSDLQLYSPDSPWMRLQSYLVSHRSLGFVLAFWVGGSLMLDTIVMPTLYMAGMMDSSSFASAGEALFLNFNQVELFLGSIVLTAVLVHRHNPTMEAHQSLGGWGLPLVMLVIAMIDRYGLTPQMGGMGMQLDWVEPEPMPLVMQIMHVGYWGLEMVKLGAGAVLLNRCFRQAL